MERFSSERNKRTNHEHELNLPVESENLECDTRNRSSQPLGPQNKSTMVATCLKEQKVHIPSVVPVKTPKGEKFMVYLIDLPEEIEKKTLIKRYDDFAQLNHKLRAIKRPTLPRKKRTTDTHSHHIEVQRLNLQLYLNSLLSINGILLHHEVRSFLKLSPVSVPPPVFPPASSAFALLTRSNTQQIPHSQPFPHTQSPSLLREKLSTSSFGATATPPSSTLSSLPQLSSNSPVSVPSPSLLGCGAPTPEPTSPSSETLSDKKKSFLESWKRKLSHTGCKGEKENSRGGSAILSRRNSCAITLAVTEKDRKNENKDKRSESMKDFLPNQSEPLSSPLSVVALSSPETSSTSSFSSSPMGSPFKSVSCYSLLPSPSSPTSSSVSPSVSSPKPPSLIGATISNSSHPVSSLSRPASVAYISPSSIPEYSPANVEARKQKQKEKGKEKEKEGKEEKRESSTRSRRSFTASLSYSQLPLFNFRSPSTSTSSSSLLVLQHKKQRSKHKEKDENAKEKEKTEKNGKKEADNVGKTEPTLSRGKAQTTDKHDMTPDNDMDNLVMGVDFHVLSDKLKEISSSPPSPTKAFLSNSSLNQRTEQREVDENGEEMKIGGGEAEEMMKNLMMMADITDASGSVKSKTNGRSTVIFRTSKIYSTSGVLPTEEEKIVEVDAETMSKMFNKNESSDSTTHLSPFVLDELVAYLDLLDGEPSEHGENQEAMSDFDF